MKPRRIAYLLTAFPTITETFVEGEFRALMARGFQVDLYATRNFRQAVGMEDRESDRGLNVCRLPYFWSREVWRAGGHYLLRRPMRTLKALAPLLVGNLPSPRSLLQTAALVPKTLAFARRMEERGTAHVHGTWGHYPATCAFLVSRLLDIPFSFTAHAGLDVVANTTFLPAKIRDARFVLTCNDANRRLLAEGNPLFAGKILSVYHGVSLSDIPPPNSLPRADPPEILAVGRLAPEKGFLDLLEACGRLHREGVRFRLRIYGEGPQRLRLEEKIRQEGLAGAATLEGVVSHSAILESASRAALAVLASCEGPARYLDGIANVLVEAMACGTPVISTSYAGSRELLMEGRFGLLVPQRDPGALAEAMKELLENPLKRRELGALGRERVVSEFDRERNVERIASLFRESLRGDPSPRPGPARGRARASG